MYTFFIVWFSPKVLYHTTLCLMWIMIYVTHFYPEWHLPPVMRHFPRSGGKDTGTLKVSNALWCLHLHHVLFFGLHFLQDTASETSVHGLFSDGRTSTGLVQFVCFFEEVTKFLGYAKLNSGLS